jgi:hypothetical protein
MIDDFTHPIPLVATSSFNLSLNKCHDKYTLFISRVYITSNWAEWMSADRIEIEMTVACPNSEKPCDD